MNTTTFTIQSVHGIKQTFVLGPSGNVGVATTLIENPAAGDSSVSGPTESDANKPR